MTLLSSSYSMSAQYEGKECIIILKDYSCLSIHPSREVSENDLTPRNKRLYL